MTEDSAQEGDLAFLRRAIDLSLRGWGNVAPNPLVGAVVVRDGKVIGEGWHAEYGGPHAEVAALENAGDTRGATMYVSLEPCAHHGRTPPCTEAILAAGIQRLVFGAYDPNPVAQGGGAILRGHGLDVTGGLADDEVRSINAPFFRSHDAARHDLPWTELKLALSLDGRIADASGSSQWITGAEAREEVHRLRAGADAIAVGIGTVLADDPKLTVRGEVQPRIAPVRVVFDRELKLPLESTLAQTAKEIPVWVITHPEGPADRRMLLETAGIRILLAEDLQSSLRLLRSEGVRTLFCEGGAGLASQLLAGDFVDRMHLIYAPLLLGPGAIEGFGRIPPTTLDTAHRWRLIESARFGADTLIRLDR